MHRQWIEIEYSMMQVDAFTSEAFHGNPAAVVFVHDQALSSEQMQTIAAENNLSETAYLEHEDQGQIADLSYFSAASAFRLRCPTFRSSAYMPRVPLLLFCNVHCSQKLVSNDCV